LYLGLVATKRKGIKIEPLWFYLSISHVLLHVLALHRTNINCGCQANPKGSGKSTDKKKNEKGQKLLEFCCTAPIGFNAKPSQHLERRFEGSDNFIMKVPMAGPQQAAKTASLLTTHLAPLAPKREPAERHLRR